MDQEKIFEARKRTLHIILILSMIGSGMSFISNLMMGSMLPMLKAMFESGAIAYPSEMSLMMEDMFDTPRPYYLSCALLYAMSLVGVILMWNLRKSGFHLYTMAQLLVLLVTLLFLGRERVPLGDIMLTLLFIVYYFISLRIIANLSTQNNGYNGNSPSENETPLPPENENDNSDNQESSNIE